jgi:hypothetical protein
MFYISMFLPFLKNESLLLWSLYGLIIAYLINLWEVGGGGFGRNLEALSMKNDICGAAILHT